MSDETDLLNLKLKDLREIAEKNVDVSGNKVKSDSITVPVDLLHELRVHQIELKMQNEELRRTQEALEHSRNHYQELYDFSPVGYITLNPEGIILEINFTATRLLGVDHQKIINQRFAKFIQDDYKDLWYRHFMEAKQKPDEQHGCELPFTDNMGKKAYYHLNCVAINEVGKVSALRVCLTDVTQRKQFEEEQRIAAATFEAQVGVLVADQNRIVLRVNSAFTRITGYSADELADQPDFLGRVGQSEPGFSESFWEALGQEGFWQGELWEKRKNGEPFALWLNVSSVHDDEGKVCNYVATFIDITERKQAEAKLNQLSDDFSTFLENTSDFVYFKGADKKYRFCSNSLAKFIGQDDWHNLIGKESKELFTQEIANIYDQSTQAVFQQGVPQLNQLEPYVDANGNKAWFNVNRWPQLNNEGKVIGVFGISRDVTVQQKIQQDLRWSHELNRKILQALPAHIAVIDSRGLIIFVNEAWTKFAAENAAPQAKNQSSVGANYLDACRSASGYGAEDASRALTGIEAVLNGTTAQFTTEYLCECKKPPFKRWYLLSVVQLQRSDGLGAVIAHLDITERKQAEQALQESQDRYRHLLENQTEIIIRCKPDHTLLYVNEAYSRFFGKPIEALIGGKWHPVVYSKDLPVVIDKLGSLSPQNPIITLECRVIGAKGKMRWCQFVNRGFFDQDGNLSEIHAVGRDITDRKKSDEALRIAAVAFETQTGIIVTDADKHILNVNQAFTRITGYSAKEAVGKTPALLHSGLQDKAFYDDLWSVVEGKKYWEGEVWDKRKDGKLLPLWESITAVLDENDKVTHYVGSFTDITVQKQAEKVLLDARNRLQNQVADTQEELFTIKAETAEINAALSVLLKKREVDKSDAQLALSDEVEATVMPLLKKLKTASSGRLQSMRLIKILEDNLFQLTQSYGRGANLVSVYQKLTPIETQVAAMIRQGHPTKVIAAALNIAEGTVSIHRKHIRRKLGLNGKADNLYSFLMSLVE
jgi:PAS domain S-box-containing protein